MLSQVVARLVYAIDIARPDTGRRTVHHRPVAEFADHLQENLCAQCLQIPSAQRRHHFVPRLHHQLHRVHETRVQRNPLVLGFRVAREQFVQRRRHFTGIQPEITCKDCRPAVLTRDFGLNSSEVPPPLNKLFARNPEAENQRISLDTSLMHAVQLMVESRHKMMPALRGRYLEALSTEILLQVIGEFSNRAMMNRAPTGIRPRDVNGVYEARDYLTQHYLNPPKIP